MLKVPYDASETQVLIRLPTTFCQQIQIRRGQSSRQATMTHFELRVTIALSILGISLLAEKREAWNNAWVSSAMAKERASGIYHSKLVAKSEREHWQAPTKDKSAKLLMSQTRLAANKHMLALTAKTLIVEISQRALLAYALNGVQPSALHKKALWAILKRSPVVLGFKLAKASSPRFQLLRLELDPEWFPIKGYSRVPHELPLGAIEATLWLRLHSLPLDREPDNDYPILNSADIKKFCKGLGIDINKNPADWKDRLKLAFQQCNKHARGLGLARFTIAFIGAKQERVQFGRK